MQFKFCVFTYYFHGIKLIFPLQVPFYLSMSDRKPTAQFLFWPELSAHPTRLARYFQTTRPDWHVTYNVPEGPDVVASFRRMRTYRNRPVWHAGRSGPPHQSLVGMYQSQSTVYTHWLSRGPMPHSQRYMWAHTRKLCRRSSIFLIEGLCP